MATSESVQVNLAGTSLRRDGMPSKIAGQGPVEALVLPLGANLGGVEICPTSARGGAGSGRGTGENSECVFSGVYSCFLTTCSGTWCTMIAKADFKRIATTIPPHGAARLRRSKKPALALAAAWLIGIPVGIGLLYAPFVWGQAGATTSRNSRLRRSSRATRMGIPAHSQERFRAEALRLTAPPWRRSSGKRTWWFQTGRSGGKRW